ncbi:MAG: uracil-DNA glycosylase [Rubellimicrobium sp.]|nr:uracil-DNA glycosylase [Rubellimicrobium sp.]
MITEAEATRARALLMWQVELGADETIGDTPVDRYALRDESPARRVRPQGNDDSAAPTPAAPPPDRTANPEADPVADPAAAARAAAASAGSLPALAAAMQAFEHSPLKPMARNFVFADGKPAARVMIVGEAPGRDEDIEGRPFVGRAGQLLDRMLAAIDLSRSAEEPGSSVYITNVLPWRPPGNRTPEAPEIAMFLPFLTRHVELAAPEVLVLMGNTPCQALLGRTGITRLRGQWTEALGRPVLPMVHPAYLLRNPPAKREAWADLLTLKARLLGRT